MFAWIAATGAVLAALALAVRLERARRRARGATREAGHPPSAATEPGAARHDSAPPEPEVLDREAFDAQHAIFGDDRMLRFLAMLASELDRRLVEIGESAGRNARAELAQHAHAVASAAGNLGFRHLMEFSRVLERRVAGLPPEELDSALDELRRSIADASTTIAALRAEIEARRDRRAAG